MIEVTDEGTVFYKTGENRLGRLPKAASVDLLAGPTEPITAPELLATRVQAGEHTLGTTPALTQLRQEDADAIGSVPVWPEPHPPMDLAEPPIFFAFGQA